MRINKEEFKEFLSSRNFDLREIGKISKRPFDQKLTPAIVTFMAEIFSRFSIKKDGFKSMDIFWSESFATVMVNEFGKPIPSDKTIREYNKIISQPLNFFMFLGIIKSVPNNKYIIVEKDILKGFARNPFDTIELMYEAFSKILKDSQFNDIEWYFSKDSPTKDDARSLVENFGEFIRQNTRIKGALEPKRIIAKIVNLLAFVEKKVGLTRGFPSKGVILYSNLLYTQTNSRDKEKPKNISRGEFKKKNNSQYSSDYLASLAKKDIRKLYENKSAVSGETGTAVHHIIPKSQCPQFNASLENLIPLTYQEHHIQAHPNGNTKLIDKDYQTKLLEIKLEQIKAKPEIYNINIFNEMLLSLGINL